MYSGSQTITGIRNRISKVITIGTLSSRSSRSSAVVSFFFFDFSDDPDRRLAGDAEEDVAVVRQDEPGF